MKSSILLRDPANPNEERLWNLFDTASKRVKAGAVGSDAENQYEIAYQALVREGMAAPIKRKYRG